MRLVYFGVFRTEGGKHHAAIPGLPDFSVSGRGFAEVHAKTSVELQRRIEALSRSGEPAPALVDYFAATAAGRSEPGRWAVSAVEAFTPDA